MPEIGLNRLRIDARTALRAALAVLLLLLVGCAQNYGHFLKNETVYQDFRKGERQSGYQYYYQGRITMPYAIIGIDKSYAVLPPRYWIAFEPTRTQLQDMSGNIYGNYRSRPYGSHITGPDGKILGVWYAILIDRNVRVDQENRTVQILFKNPESTNQN